MSIPGVQHSMVTSHQKEKYFLKYCQLGAGIQDRREGGAGLKRALC